MASIKVGPMEVVAMGEMAKHTAGPWKVDSFDKQRVFAGQMRICDIRGWGHLTGGLRFSDEEATAIQDANAVLIAAAPDLLKALKGYMFLEQTNGGKNPHQKGTNRHHAFEVARAAIAKAEPQ